MFHNIDIYELAEVIIHCFTKFWSKSRIQVTIGLGWRSHPNYNIDDEYTLYHAYPDEPKEKDFDIGLRKKYIKDAVDNITNQHISDFIKNKKYTIYCDSNNGADTDLSCFKKIYKYYEDHYENNTLCKYYKICPNIFIIEFNNVILFLNNDFGAIFTDNRELAMLLDKIIKDEHMNENTNILKDRNALKRLVESYGKQDVINFVSHLSESYGDKNDLKNDYLILENRLKYLNAIKQEQAKLKLEYNGDSLKAFQIVDRMISINKNLLEEIKKQLDELEGKSSQPQSTGLDF